MTSLLQVRGLTLSFGAVVVASGYDFDLKADERLAVIGANGAGKTTFINMVTGYIKPTSGTIAFDGNDITKLNPRRIVRLGVGRSFQLPQLFLEHTVRESIELAVAAQEGRLSVFRRLRDSVSREEIDHTLEVVGLSARANDVSGSLPEGHRKLLNIAMALVLRPKLLIMDEPTSGVAADEKHPLMATIMKALSEAQRHVDLRRTRCRHRQTVRDPSRRVDLWAHRGGWPSRCCHEQPRSPLRCTRTLRESDAQT